MKKIILIVLVMLVLLALVGTIAFADNPQSGQDEILELTDDENYRFYRQERTNPNGKLLDHRVIAVIRQEWLDEIEHLDVKLVFSNGEDTRIFDELPQTVFKQVVSHSTEGKIVYKAADDCVILGYVITNAPKAYLPTACILDVEDVHSENLLYELQPDDTYTVVGMGDCTDSSVIIPPVHDGKLVTGIGDEAFANQSDITDISIPDSITSIGTDAFLGCDSLNYTRKNSCTYLGNQNNPYLFLCGVEVNGSRILIDPRTKVIGDYAFNCCFDIRTLTLPDSIQYIGNKAFNFCSKLVSLTLPANLKHIGESATIGCSKLNSISIDENNPVYYVENNCLIERESKTLLFGCNTSTIPDDIVAISENAFNNRQGLTAASIPNSVKTIGYAAFEGCTSLTSLTLSNQITHLPEFVFSLCPITSLTIPESVTRIDGLAFQGNHVESLHIPIGVTTIDSDAFSNSLNLKSISVDTANTVYQSEGNCLIEKANQTVILGCETSVIPADVKKSEKRLSMVVLISNSSLSQTA